MNTDKTQLKIKPVSTATESGFDILADRFEGLRHQKTNLSVSIRVHPWFKKTL
jgi:hypothetical protein